MKCYNHGMTIKKPMRTASTAGAAPTAGGGATIANRFKLDMTEPDKKTVAVGGKAATCAGVAGLLALAVAGILTYILYQHWDFLMPA